MTNEQKIIKLNEIWYDLIGPEHHKDRDCHFYINQTFSYGSTMKYCVEHYGYINDYKATEWDTKEEAEKELIRLIYEMIDVECNCLVGDDGVYANRDKTYFVETLQKAKTIIE